MSDYIGKARANFEEVLGAFRREAEQADGFYTSVEKQKHHVAKSLDRCRRCGEHVVLLIAFGQPVTLCTTCEDYLRQRDTQPWFVDLIAESNRKARAQKEDSNEHS